MKKKPLYAGFSKININPKEPEGMTLYGMPRLYPGARGILDNLYARACYLESGDKKFLMIVCDLVLTKHEFMSKMMDVLADYESILDGISKSTKIDKKNIWLCATHCHSSVGEGKGSPPYISKVLNRYIDMLTKKLIQVGIDTVNNRQRVKIGYGRGEIENVAGNRRAKLSDGTVVTAWADGPTPPPGLRIVDRGLVDKNVGIIVFKSMKNKPLGAIVNYNSHIHSYPILYFTSEYAGAVSRLLDKKIPGITTVYTNGAEGNTALCANLTPQPRDMNKWNSTFKSEMNRMSSIMVRKIAEIYKNMSFESLVKMDMGETTLKIPSTNPYLPKKKYATEKMAVVTINDLALVGEVEEAFVELALGIKKGSPYKSTFIIGMNGERNFYFPTTHAIEEGGYEAYMWMKPGSFEKTIDQTVKLLKKMKKR